MDVIPGGTVTPHADARHEGERREAQYVATDGSPYPYDAFSELAGPFVEPGSDYRVKFVPIMGLARRIRAYGLVALAFVFEITFFVWLLKPSHYPENTGDWRYYLALSMVVSIGIIEGMRLINVGTLALATLNARDPEPVREQTGTRIAFLTTIVPINEPLEMAEKTLEAAIKVRHDGPMDVWLLDEGNDPDVKAMCARLGVHHFSRKGVARYNQPSGAFKAKTKHGNYNAWLDNYADNYDFWVSVDTDHVPHPNFAERLLGYFRDPDVAFVVGPQVYGNYDNLITKAAESQQYLFHGVIQRAGNRLGAAMFVGTNNAVRISALQQIGGLADSITEDAATSITWHSTTNPRTGNKFKSVYTPDVLAVGEGPTSWADYFIQQGRWARGTDEVILRRYWTGAKGLPFLRRIHYGLLMSYYPSAALAWVLGCFNMAFYLLTGVGGVIVSAQLCSCSTRTRRCSRWGSTSGTAGTTSVPTRRMVPQERWGCSSRSSLRPCTSMRWSRRSGTAASTSMSPRRGMTGHQTR